MTNTRKLVMLSFLTALTIILARFVSIQTTILRISFEFFPIVVAAILFGPIGAGVTAVIADIIGALLFPAGTFFPGFTVSAFITGLIYAFFFYQKDITFFRTIIGIMTKLLIVDMVLVSIWLMILFRMPIEALIPTRLIKLAVMLPIETVLIYFGARPLIVQLNKRTGLIPGMAKEPNRQKSAV